MNRLWVRLSLTISALILLSALLPLASFLIFALTHAPQTSTGLPGPPPPFDPWSRIPQELLRAIVYATVFGVLGGVVASRFLASPISKLAAAAKAIGHGDLTTRVELKRNTQEIDELAHAFNTMAAELQRAADLRNSLMADVSHELRTPLTVLEGNLRAALDHVYELDDEQVANLYEQSRHLIRLVNELRELALAESAQLPLYLQPVELDPLVQETVAAFEPLAEEKQVQLLAQVEPALPAVTADRTRVRQVLHNLLGNALRHTPPGGSIVVAASARNGGVDLSVRDTGDGMEPQQLEHVFDRFYRTDPSRNRETGGSGLGLAIVKAIVEAHGGLVTANSTGLGMGSTFTIHLT